MGQFEAAFALGNRPGERALLVAEKLAFNQVFRHGGAIDPDERGGGPGALPVKRPRHQFLARPALPGDQDGGLGAGDLADQQPQLFHRLAFAQQLVPGFILLRVAEVLVDLDQLVEVLRFLEDHLQLVGGIGLEHVVEGPVAHALHRRFHRAESGDDDDQRLLGMGLQFQQKLRAFAVGQADIQENEVEGVAIHQLAHTREGAAGGHLVTVLAQLLFQVAADNRIVLHYNNLVNRHVGESSRRALAAVEFGDEVRALPVDRGQLAGRNQPAAQQPLLIFPVENNELHGRVLVSAQERADLRMPRALVET